MPAVVSITELALILGLPRHMIRDHADAGRIPTFKIGPRKRLVALTRLRDSFPELYDAYMMKADAYEAGVFAEEDDDG